MTLSKCELLWMDKNGKMCILFVIEEDRQFCSQDTSLVAEETSATKYLSSWKLWPPGPPYLFPFMSCTSPESGPRQAFFPLHLPFYWSMISISVLSRVWFFATPDCSLTGFSVHGIFQAKILEWVATSFSRGSSRPRDRTCVSRVSSIRRQVLYH